MEKPKEGSKKEELNKKDFDKKSLLVAVVISSLVGAGISYAIIILGFSFLSEHIKETIIVVVILICLFGLFALLILYFKTEILKFIFGVSESDITSLKNSSEELMINVYKRDIQSAKNNFGIVVKKAAAWYSWLNYKRFVLLGLQTLMVTFGGLLGSILIYQQNERIDVQNNLISNQNYRLDQQTYLQEAERRSSLVFLMSNILDKVDFEIREQRDSILRKNRSITGIEKFYLSKPLIGRIVGLSNSLRPYYLLEGDSLSKVLASPERGQLFIALANSQLNDGTQYNIFREGDFSYAIINNVDISNSNLSAINLKEAELAYADLSQSRLTNADLENSDFSGAYLESCLMGGVEMKGSNLSGTNLKKARIFMSDLSNSTMQEITIDRRMEEVLRNRHKKNNQEIALEKTRKTDLSFSILRGVNLKGADLSGAIFYEADLSSVNFDNVKGISAEQLKSAKRIYNSQNLDDNIEKELARIRPCIFNEKGCVQ